jgi:hypothetical protein
MPFARSRAIAAVKSPTPHCANCVPRLAANTIAATAIKAAHDQMMDALSLNQPVIISLHSLSCGGGLADHGQWQQAKQVAPTPH